MGWSGASSVLEGRWRGRDRPVVGTVFCLDGCGGFAPCGDMSSVGPQTATIAEDLPFEHQTITIPLGSWMVQASICQGDRCLSAVVGPVMVGPDCRVPDETVGQVADFHHPGHMYVQRLSSCTNLILLTVGLSCRQGTLLIKRSERILCIILTLERILPADVC